MYQKLLLVELYIYFKNVIQTFSLVKKGLSVIVSPQEIETFLYEIDQEK